MTAAHSRAHRLFATCLATVVIEGSAVGSFAAVVKVASVSGDSITLAVGEKGGVRVGMTGWVIQTVSAGGTDQEASTTSRSQVAPAWNPVAGAAVSFQPSGAEFIWIPAGTFEMGCVAQEQGCPPYALPLHTVTISRGFWLMATEVTVRQYRLFAQATGVVMPPPPGFAQTDAHPVAMLSWEQAVGYCHWAGGRLPTEAEWEWAARGGLAGKRYPWGDSINHDRANYGADEGRSGLVLGKDRWLSTSPVRSFQRFGYGLYDMVGNVSEWCADWFSETYYSVSPSVDPQGPPTGVERVNRDGSATLNAAGVEVSLRSRADPNKGLPYVGFRCARDL